MSDNKEIPALVKRKIVAEANWRATNGHGGVDDITRDNFILAAEFGYSLASPEAARYHQEPVVGSLKTAKEILQSDDDFLESISEIEQALIIERMELYADQFRQSPVVERDERLVWVKASERLPEKVHNYHVKIQYEYEKGKSGIWNTASLWNGEHWEHPTEYDWNGKPKKANVIEWLSETPSHEGKDVVVIDLEAMRKDKSEGSYYYGWQANIAMAFKDEYHREFGSSKKMDGFMHEIANNAAKNFLDMLLIQPESQKQ